MRDAILTLTTEIVYLTRRNCKPFGGFGVRADELKGFFYSLILNLFIMIYKFNDYRTGHILELAHDLIENELSISVTNEDSTDEPQYQCINLNDRQLYKLIGALHEIQKDIRREKGGSHGQG